MQEMHHESKGSNAQDAVCPCGPLSSKLYPEHHKNAEKRESADYAEDFDDETDRFLSALVRWFMIRLFEAKFIDFVGSVTGIALLIVGIIAACIYNDQLGEMRKQIANSDRNFRSDEQARIGISFIRFDLSKETVGQIFEVPADIANYGKTPALKVQIKGVVSILKRNTEKADLPKGDIKHGYSLIRIGLVQPGQQIKDWPLMALDTNGPSVPVITAPELIGSLKSAEYTMVVHGRITYEDIFGQEHWLTFCDYLNGLVGGSPECFSYNASDESESPNQKTSER